MDRGDIQRIKHIKRHCAVSMCILQIGELANALSQEFRAETSKQIQWNLVRGMRNWIAHAYDEVETDIVWGTANEDIPNLLQFCDSVLEKYHAVIE